MLSIAAADGKPVQYRNFIRNRFTLREVLVSTVPLHKDHDPKIKLAPGVQDAPDAIQNRSGCCGTMNLPEHCGEEETLQADIEAFKKSLEPQGEKTKRSR